MLSLDAKKLRGTVIPERVLGVDPPGLSQEAAFTHRLGSGVKGQGECVTEWHESFYGNGRPRKNLPEKRSMSGSRWVFMQHHEITRESIDGLVVRHTCDNGSCINPDHLVIGTHMDNVRDSMERGRNIRGEAHAMAKIKEEDVVEIRKTYIKGTSRWNPGNGIDMRSRYGISQQQLSDITTGKKWKHVIS